MTAKIKVELGLDLINELKSIGSIDMTIEDVVRDMVSHCSTCDPFVNREQ